MEKKRSIGVKLVTILVLSVFCLVLTSCGGAGFTYHYPPDYIEVGVSTTLELGFVPLYYGSFRENKVKCHYRLTGETMFKTIPMIKVGYRKGKEGCIYSCTLPAFSIKQKEQFGSVEYYFDFYCSWPTNRRYGIRDYTATTDFSHKLEESKKKGENVVVVYGRAYKFSSDSEYYLNSIEGPIPYRVPLHRNNEI